MAMSTERTCDREVRFRSIVEHATDLIVLYDLEFRCLYVNPAVESALGWKAEDLLQRLRDLIIVAAKTDQERVHAEDRLKIPGDRD